MDMSEKGEKGIIIHFYPKSITSRFFIFNSKQKYGKHSHCLAVSYVYFAPELTFKNAHHIPLGFQSP